MSKASVDRRDQRACSGGKLSGTVKILTATVIAGVAGFVVTFLVYWNAGPAAYALFAVFWAALYLVVGGLSGVQQEVTRASGNAPSPGPKASAFWFAAAAAASVLLLILGTAPFWAERIFPAGAAGLVFPLAVGAASYVLVATLSGCLYGVTAWTTLAWMMTADALLRLALVGAALAVTNDVVVLAWCVALPFPLSVMVLVPSIRARLTGNMTLDVGYRGLIWNVARTISAALATAVLVSGFPMFLSATAQAENPALMGELIFTITLSRAPLIVTVMSLQSLLVVRFRNAQHGVARLVTMLLTGLIGVGAVLALCAWWLGPTVFTLVSGADTQIGGQLIAILVLSSAFIGAMCVTGPALLAQKKHFWYAAGWILAAIATVAALLLPLEVLERTAVAVLAGPLVGLVVHLSVIALGSGSSPRR